MFGPYAGMDPKTLIDQKMATVARGARLNLSNLGSIMAPETNLYGYVMNDPVNFTDSTGLITDQDRARGARYAAIAAIGGAVLGGCTTGGVGLLGGTAIGAGIGYLGGISPGLLNDFTELVNGKRSPDNFFNRFLGE